MNTNWKLSARGNYMREYRGYKLTIFVGRETGQFTLCYHSELFKVMPHWPKLVGLTHRARQLEAEAIIDKYFVEQDTMKAYRQSIDELYQRWIQERTAQMHPQDRSLWLFWKNNILNDLKRQLGSFTKAKAEIIKDHVFQPA